MLSRRYTFIALALLVIGICYVVLFSAFIGAARITESAINSRLAAHGEKLELLLGHIMSESYSALHHISGDISSAKPSVSDLINLVDFYIKGNVNAGFVKYVGWQNQDGAIFVDVKNKMLVNNLNIPFDEHEAESVGIYDYIDRDGLLIPMISAILDGSGATNKIALLIDHDVVMRDLFSLDKENSFQFLVFIGPEAKPMLISQDYDTVSICNTRRCGHNVYKASFFSGEGYFQSMKIFANYNVFINLFFDPQQARSIFFSNFFLNVVILSIFLIANIFIFWIFKCLVTVDVKNMVADVDSIIMGYYSRSDYLLGFFSKLSSSIRCFGSSFEVMKFDLANYKRMLKNSELIREASIKVSNDVLLHYSELKTLCKELEFLHITLQDKCDFYNSENTRLGRVNRQKSEFLANISHEIRTPLNAINGYAEILIRYNELDSSKRFEYVKNINDSARYILSLVQEILDQAKAEYGTIFLNESVCDIRELINQCIMLNKVNTDIAIDVEFDADVVMVMMDVVRIKQVVNNVISNAVKFSLSGHTVQIRTQINGSCIEIVITDTGIGIENESVSRIFEVFGQGNTSKSDEGIGMGLSLSKKIVELHGGTLVISSMRNCGTSVTVVLPIFRLRRFEKV